MSDEPRSWSCESWTLFTDPYKAVAYERDRGNGHVPRVHVRVWSGSEERWLKKSLGMTVRNGTGDLDADRIAEMQVEGRRVARDLLDDDVTLPRVSTAARPDSDPSELTLKEGFRLAFRPKSLSGKYREGRYRRDAMRARDDLLRILSPARTWASLRRSDFERIWETVAEVRAGRKTWHSDKLTNDDGEPMVREPGWRWCVRMITDLVAVGHWLEEEKYLEPGMFDVPHQWKKSLKKDWKALTGESTRPAKHRYTKKEAGRILQALPNADPRIRLALTLGVEDRLGQVLRTRRSHLDLSPVGAFGLGRLDVVGRGNKRGEIQDLDPEQRDEIDEALGPNGYLHGLELAYQEGRRDDYPLFPQYAFRDGVPVAPMNAPDEPMSSRTLRTLYNELEKSAGVEHRKGRGWYGLRRLAADLAPDYTNHAGVLNNIGHWADSRTREDYQKAANPEVAAKAARVRRQLRSDLRVRAEEEVEETPTELLEQLIFGSEPEVFGSLFRSLATLDPAKALDVLKTVRGRGLQTVAPSEALDQLSQEDLLALLQTDDPEVRSEALEFLALLGGAGRVE